MKNLLLLSFLLINLSIVAQRDPRNKGEANVFWNGTYPLYSLTSDQEIKPNSSGKYNFWGTTNENPVPKEYSLIKGNTLYVYKFISYDECVKLCNEIRQRNGMQLLNTNQQNNTVITTSKTDTIFTGQLVKSKYGYSGNGEIKYPNGFRYKGGIINNKPDGKSCEIQTAKGSLYVGDFKLNNIKIFGRGKCYPGDGNGTYDKNQIHEGTFNEGLESGGKIVSGFITMLINDNKSESKKIFTVENSQLISFKYIDLRKDKENSKLEIIIPKYKDDKILGSYNVNYYENDNLKMKFEIEVLENKKPRIKQLTDFNGGIYSTEITFGEYPLPLNKMGDFLSINEAYKRISDGKMFYLDGSFKLTEGQNGTQSVLSKEQFIEAVNKDQNKVYACDCCKKSIPGYKKAITKEGEEFGAFLIEMTSPDMVYTMSYVIAMEMVKKAPGLYKNKDLSPIGFMQSEYPYCSKFCYKTCKE